MENNTKIAIGLVAAVVVGYIVYKGSKPKDTMTEPNTSPSMPDTMSNSPVMPSDAGTDVKKPSPSSYFQQGDPFGDAFINPTGYTGGNYKDVVIPKGTKFEGCRVFGYGVSFVDNNKYSPFDDGFGNARWGEFDVTSVVSYEREDMPAPFEKPKNVSGYSLYIGNIVNIVLTKDVVRSAEMKLIIYT
jgi:hypothetical protein